MKSLARRVFHLHPSLFNACDLSLAAPPRIDRTTLKDTHVKAGQHIRFDVKISGEPPPTKTWFHNKARVESKDELTVCIKLEHLLHFSK